MNLANAFNGASGSGYLAPAVKVVSLISEQALLVTSLGLGLPEGYTIDDELTDW